MDAKSKANFIHSVASGQMLLCLACNSQNTPDSKYCSFCGAEIPSAPPEQAGNALPAFQKLADNPPLSNQETEKYKAPKSAFANGLPSWDILPPQVMVRRH